MNEHSVYDKSFLKNRNKTVQSIKILLIEDTQKKNAFLKTNSKDVKQKFKGSPKPTKTV